MKSFFKKSVISIFVMGMAGTSFADNACLPRLTGWFVGGEGLYLRPENGDLDYVTVFPVATASSGIFQTQNISLDYQWGWRLYGGIKFTRNDDLTLSWLQIQTSDNDTVNIPSTNLSEPRWQGIEAWNSATGKVSFKLDDAYFVWGHTINFRNPWSVRFAAGVEYAKVNSDLTITGINIGAAQNGTGFAGNSRFIGVGPHVEFDMTYHFPYNITAFGEANAALLVGTRKISQNAIDGIGGDTELDSTSFSTRHVVVPKVGARLGLSYSYLFGQTGGEGACLSALTVDAGWEVDSYIHAIERSEGEDIIEAPGFGRAFFFGFANTKTSNFSNQGLFVGLKYSAGVL